LACVPRWELAAPPVPSRRSEAGRAPMQGAVTALPEPVDVRIAGKVAPLHPRGGGVGGGGAHHGGCRRGRGRSVRAGTAVFTVVLRCASTEEIPAPTEEVDAGRCGGEAIYRAVCSTGYFRSGLASPRRMGSRLSRRRRACHPCRRVRRPCRQDRRHRGRRNHDRPCHPYRDRRSAVSRSRRRLPWPSGWRLSYRRWCRPRVQRLPCHQGRLHPCHQGRSPCRPCPRQAVPRPR